jgi:hypothetical protein
MNKVLKKRLCWNCEGSVAVNAETCPYCGVSVIPATLEGAEVGFTPSYNKEAASGLNSQFFKSPYSSHYTANAVLNNEEELDEELGDEFQNEVLLEKEERKKTYKNRTKAKPIEEDPPADEEAVLDADQDFKETLKACVLLLSGSVLFLFGLTLAFFAQDGLLTLQWDATLWFVYVAIAMLLLFFGSRSLKKL